MPNNNRRNQAHRAVTRNLVAKHQWQRGGVHGKSHKAKRQNGKIRSESAVDFFMFVSA